MPPLLAYGVILALTVALVWPGSTAGRAVLAVTGSLASTLRGGST